MTDSPAKPVVLLADIHGFLDNLKAPIELVEHRVGYYRLTISALLRAVGVELNKGLGEMLRQARAFSRARHRVPVIAHAAGVEGEGESGVRLAVRRRLNRDEARLIVWREESSGCEKARRAPLCPAGHPPHRGGDWLSLAISPIADVAGWRNP